MIQHIVHDNHETDPFKRKIQKPTDFDKSDKSQSYAISADYLIDLQHSCQFVFPYWHLHKTTVKQRWEGKSLQSVLLTEWSYLQQMLPPNGIYNYCVNKQITINKTECTPDQILKHDDVIHIFAHKHEPPVVYNIGNGITQQIGSLTVLHETEHVMVILKPATISTHPSSLYRRNSIINMIQKGYCTALSPKLVERSISCNFCRVTKEIMHQNLNTHSNKTRRDKQIKDEKKKFWIVHRLDRLTSGLLIIAKDLLTANYLMKQFRERVIEKEYLALVHGIFDGERYKIVRRNIARSNKPQCYNRMVLSAPGVGKSCETHFKLIWFNRERNVSLVKCKPRTGRTHQIRVHLAFVCGTPIVNDPLYSKYTHGAEYSTFPVHKKILHQVNGKGMEASEGLDEEEVKNDTFECHVCDGDGQSIDAWWDNLRASTTVLNNGIHLHAFKYKGNHFQYQTPTPKWACPSESGTNILCDVM